MAFVILENCDLLTQLVTLVPPGQCAAKQPLTKTHRSLNSDFLLQSPGMGGPSPGHPGMGGPSPGHPGMGGPSPGHPGMGGPSPGHPSMGGRQIKNLKKSKHFVFKFQ